MSDGPSSIAGPDVSSSGTVSFTVLDVLLPVLNGYEVARRISCMLRQSPAMTMSFTGNAPCLGETAKGASPANRPIKAGEPTRS